MAIGSVLNGSWLWQSQLASINLGCHLSKVRFADIHVSHLSSGGVGVPGTLARACKSTVPGCSMRSVCLSASIPALGRTRHPFAVSDSVESSQKIEFVFSASPETIRREPQEGDLLRSVGKMQDLAVCAFRSSC
jgi:hypothetical protein